MTLPALGQLSLLCGCHDQPMEWRTDRRQPSGGRWVCRIARRGQQAAQYRRNPEARKRHLRTFYERHREEQQAYSRAWAQAHPGYGREWREANPEHWRRLRNTGKHRRRARLADVPSEPWTREQVWAKTDGRCWICGDLLIDGWHADHVVPIARGGPDILDNLLPACSDCNLSKGTKLVAR